MDIIFSGDQKNIDLSHGTGVALGNFDGLHLGHMALIDRVIRICQDKGYQSLVYTFRNHPENMISNAVVTPLINTNETKAKILSDSGLDFLYFENFDQEMMMRSPEKFIKEIIVEKLNAKLVVVGFHYHFGHKGLGDTKLLKEICDKYSIEVHIVPPVKIDGTIVSSSVIRQLIQEGEMEQAARFLGRKFSIVGKVERGKNLGSKIGFPTINLIPDQALVIPANGVYLTYTILNECKYPSITNVGRNPTVENKGTRVETHLLDFNGNLYEQEVTIQFIKKTRDEIKFSGIGELARQISLDVQFASKYFSKSIYNKTNIC